jgi:hypothetical protein
MKKENMIEYKVPVIEVIHSSPKGNDYEEKAKDFFKKEGYFVWTTKWEKNGFRKILFFINWIPRKIQSKEEFIKGEGINGWQSNMEDKKMITTFKNIIRTIINDDKRLNFLLENFFQRTKIKSGIPDLFIFKHNKFYFVEVKSPHDRIGLNQIKWIKQANKNRLPSFIIAIKNE